jgi:uncharacterized protein YdeI (YjbR/CyaY-like superfamily)
MGFDGEPIRFRTPADWRAWLGEHHASDDGAWVAIDKAHTGGAMTLLAATLEALCFGWIDSAMRPLDADRYALRFTPRRKGSRWSEPNKRRALELITEGRMTDAGLARIEEAKASGSWGEDPQP